MIFYQKKHYSKNSMERQYLSIVYGGGGRGSGVVCISILTSDPGLTFGVCGEQEKRWHLPLQQSLLEKQNLPFGLQLPPSSKDMISAVHLPQTFPAKH